MIVTARSMELQERLHDAGQQVGSEQPAHRCQQNSDRRKRSAECSLIRCGIVKRLICIRNSTAGTLPPAIDRLTHHRHLSMQLTPSTQTPQELDVVEDRLRHRTAHVRSITRP